MESISGIKKLEVSKGRVTIDGETTFPLDNLIAVDIDLKEMHSFTVTFEKE